MNFWNQFILRRKSTFIKWNQWDYKRDNYLSFFSFSICEKISIRSENATGIFSLSFDTDTSICYCSRMLCFSSNVDSWILYVHCWFCCWSSRKNASNQCGNERIKKQKINCKGINSIEEETLSVILSVMLWV